MAIDQAVPQSPPAQRQVALQNPGQTVIGAVYWKKQTLIYGVLAILAYAVALTINVAWIPVQNVNETPYRIALGLWIVFLTGMQIVAAKRPNIRAGIYHKAQL